MSSRDRPIEDNFTLDQRAGEGQSAETPDRTDIVFELKPRYVGGNVLLEDLPTCIV